MTNKTTEAAVRVEHIGRATAIYALCEYPSWRPRYVGKTVRYLHERHKDHIRNAKRGSALPVSRWLRKQMHQGKWLAIKLIEYVPAEADWAAREKYWIAQYRQEHGALLNMTDGGEGLTGLARTKEHREKIAKSLRTGEHFNCETCGAQFWRKQRDIANGHNRFCSRPCYAASLKGVSKPLPHLAVERGVAAAALKSRQRTHCKREHPLSGDNLFRTSGGSRGCKECRKIHKATYRSKANG